MIFTPGANKNSELAIGVTNEEINVLRESNTGMGLKLLKSRMILLNAELVYSKDDGISSVRLIVPVKQ
ncbi:MAG: hypothetical protein H0U95_13275 [Bacteroidetes bacterium]|nr:hypothetical protein [Bacteroidota bacterium]